MKQDYTDITVVLDRSGSMASIQDDVRGSFDAFMAEQRRQPGELRVTLVQFDTDYEVVYAGRDVKDVPRLDLKPRGCTALFDAVGRAIVEAGKRFSSVPEHERPAKVIFIIVTDGQENSSREFVASQIKDMIDHQTNVYSWEFVFLGANHDAFTASQGMGIKQSSTMNFASNAQGVQHAYSAISSKVSAYRGDSRSAEELKTCGGIQFNSYDYAAQAAAGAQFNPTVSDTTNTPTHDPNNTTNPA